MKNALHSFQGSHKSSAKVVDGKLILSFPGALKPVVWQMDFSHVKASALEVQENKDEGIYTLTLKTPKGENVDIAPFAKKEHAVSGLMAASKALEGAQGKIRPAASSGKADDGGGQTVVVTGAKSSGRWTAPLLGVVMLLLLVFVWSLLAPQSPSSVGRAGGSAAGSGPDAAGVPMSADDFLRGQ